MAHRTARYRQDARLLARMVLVMGLLAALYLGFVAVLWYAGVGFIPLIVVAAVMLGVQFYFSDKLVLASMGAKTVSPEQAPELHALVERLCLIADIPKPKVAMVDTSVPNAFATGRSPNAAVIAVTTGLLDRLDPPEVEAVLMHELAHVKNRDVAVITIASFFATVASLIMQFAFWGFGFGGGRDRRSGSAVILVYLASLLVWIISFFLIRALSRYRELAADRGAALLTGQPQHLASALLKISGTMQRIPEDDLRRVEEMNAFFIFPALRRGSIENLFSTHPSLEARLDQLQRIERQLEGL